MAQLFTPYSSAKPYFEGPVPPGLPETDVDRLRSYLLYEEMYWNHPDTYRITMRGDEENPIYIPPAKKIVEAVNRYLAVDWNYNIEGTGTAQTRMDVVLRALFAREMVHTKFATQRRFGLIRGDAVWHITADDRKPLGSRISIHEVHPGQYFPIMDPDEPDRLLGVYLVDQVKDPRFPDTDKVCDRRQAYRKAEDGTITTELILFEPGKWDDRPEVSVLKDGKATVIKVLRDEESLPPEITAIPVYHVRNTHDSAWPFGSSTLRGIETVIAGVQQGTTDQALAVALGGLGVFWTDAGPPRDSQGNVMPWQMGPGQMTEVPQGSTMGRVGELSSVSPSLDHINFLIDEAQSGAGVPDLAVGRVDVAVAESGISLTLQMSPLIAGNAEKESAILGVTDQFLYDLTHMWFPAYEELSEPTVEVTSVVGDPLPKNRTDQVTEIVTLYQANLITTDMAIEQLGELGYRFPAGAAAKLLEQAAATAVNSDPFAARSESELSNANGNSNNNQ